MIFCVIISHSNKSLKLIVNPNCETFTFLYLLKIFNLKPLFSLFIWYDVNYTFYFNLAFICLFCIPISIKFIT